MEHSFSRFVYLDTCIFSHVAKTESLWRPLQDYLRDNDLCLALSGAHLLELSKAQDLHDSLAAILLRMPSAFIKPPHDVLKEEIVAHPQRRSASLLECPLNQELLTPGGPERVRDYFRNPTLQRWWPHHVELSAELPSRWDEVKDNYPPGKTGKYTRDQAAEFATCLIYQELCAVDRTFLETFRERVEDLKIEVFRSEVIRGLVTFYKYYLDQRKPKPRSDLGDLLHLYPIPYCELAVLERDLCETLRKISKHHGVLDSTAVSNIDFFKTWKY